MPKFLTGLPLTTWIAGGVALFIAIALGLVILQKDSVIGELRRDNEAKAAALVIVQTDLNQCRSNRNSLQASLNEQNAAVERLRSEGEATATRLAGAAETARREALRANERVSRILATSGRSCEDADNLILNSLGE